MVNIGDPNGFAPAIVYTKLSCSSEFRIPVGAINSFINRSIKRRCFIKKNLIYHGTFGNGNVISLSIFE